MEKKKVLTAVAVGAATVAAGVGASQVHADSVTVTKQQIGDETKVTTTTVKDNASQAKIAKDKQAVSDQQNVVNKAKASMDSAQSKVDQDSANTAAAQKKADDAKSKLDSAKANTDTTQVKNKINSDQQQISNDQGQISNVKNDISTDQANISKDKQAISNASQNAKDDQAKLTQDQNSLSNANSQLENDQNKLNGINGQIKNIQSELTNSENNVYDNVITNPGLTLGDLEKMQNDPAGAANDVAAVDEKGMQINHYIDSPALENISYDSSTGLTTQQSQDLSEWVATLLNEFRKSVGINSEVIATVGSAKVSQEVAEDYNKDNWDNLNHDMNALMDLQKRYGFPDQMDEDKYDSLSGEVHFNNLNDVYKFVYNGLVECLFDDADSDFGHLKDLSGIDWVNGNKDQNPNGDLPEYIGVSVDKYGAVHYNLISSYEVKDAGTYWDSDFNPHKAPETMDMTTISKPSTDDNNQNLTNSLNTLQEQANTLQGTVSQDQQTVNNLTNQVNADKAKLAQDTPAGLTDQLNKDQQQLVNDQAKLSNLQKDLADAQNQLTQDQDALKNVNSPAAQAALAQAQQDYANAVKDLNDAQSQENTDRAALAQFQQDYADALAKLNELETILKNDEGETTTVSVQWIKNQHPATTSEISNRYVLGNNARQNSASQAATNRTVSQFDGMEEVQAAEVPGLRRSNRNNGLPDTGDRQNNAASVAGLLGLGLAGILSMFGLAERKKQA